MEGRCIEKKAYTLFLSPLCRLIWPASISPERLLRAGSEPIYPRATLTKTVGPFRHVPGWGSPLPCCPAFCIIRLEQLFDNWSKCAWYVSYTRGFDQRNGWEFSPFSLSLPRSIVTESSYPRAISSFNSLYWSGGRMDRWRVASDGLIQRVKNCSINTLSPVMSTSGC